MRTAIVGSRTFPMTKDQSDFLKESNLGGWAELLAEGKKLVEQYVDRVARLGNSIVSGGATGPDTWAEEHAKELGINAWILKPNYDKYGRGATFRRNKDIVDSSDEIIAFWDLVSRGTEHTIKYAIKQHKPIIVINPSGQLVFAADENDWADFEALKEHAPKMEIPSEKA
jgi:hypothetical protein